MAEIAVLGMGLLGAGFAENLLRKGHVVRVWNRTPTKCEPLVALGATHAATPADAVRGAERVHLVLSEDVAVDPVIDQLRPGLGPDVPLVDHSTNLPQAVAARFAALRAAGVRYLHAPVFMGPANAREGTGLMLLCGPPHELEALRPALSEMTGRLIDLGERADKAAAIKLTGNGMLLILTAGMGDLFRMGQALGLDPQETVGLFDAFGPTPAGMGRRVLAAGQGPVGFELSMARKDCRLMIESAGGSQALAVLPAIAAAMDEALAQGRGAEDFAVFAKPGGG